MTQYDAPVALLPPRAPVPPNPGAVDHGIYPFDFARMGFDLWTSPPGCVGSAQRDTGEQHLGQTHIWATTPPCMYEGPVRRSGGIATHQGPRPA